MKAHHWPMIAGAALLVHGAPAHATLFNWSWVVEGCPGVGCGPYAVNDVVSGTMDLQDNNADQTDVSLILTGPGGTVTGWQYEPGSGPGFTVGSDSQAGTQVTAGADVQGTIDGQTASGLGSVLSLPTGTGGAVGLSLAVTTTAADLAATGGSLGRVAFTPGLAQRLVTLIGDANGSTGTITTAQSGATARVKQLQTQIDAWDSRLTSYRQTLTTQFTAMETAMSKLKSSMSALSSLTSGTTSSSSSSGTLSTG